MLMALVVLGVGGVWATIRQARCAQLAAKPGNCSKSFVVPRHAVPQNYFQFKVYLDHWSCAPPAAANNTPENWRAVRADAHFRPKMR